VDFVFVLPDAEFEGVGEADVEPFAFAGEDVDVGEFGHWPTL